MAKGVYLNTREGGIERVYSQELKAKLSSLVEMDPQPIFPEQFESRAEALRQAEVVFSTWGMPSMTQDQIRHYLPNVKAVFYGAGSVQAFARPFLDCGVKVVSAWAANAVPVAEYAHAQILLANKGFFTVQVSGGASRDLRSHKTSYPGNYRVKVGLLGAGMIGRMVIERLRANSVEVLVFDPFLPDDAARQLGVIKADLATVFSTCQTISNHLANKKEIEGILDKPLFDSMLPTACFINTGRGAQVNESDLCDALMAQPARSAVLDVTWPEPPAEDSRLRQLPNVFYTPHIAGSLGNEVERMAEYVIEEYVRLQNGQPLLYEVVPELLETMA